MPSPISPENSHRNMNGNAAEVAYAAVPPPLEWKFSQVFGERPQVRRSKKKEPNKQKPKSLHRCNPGQRSPIWRSILKRKFKIPIQNQDLMKIGLNSNSER